MAVFHYKAVRLDGQREKGSIEATTPGEAKQVLREQHLIILSLTEATPSKRQIMKMSFEQQVIFTTQLAQLLKANVPLYESLQALEEQAKGESYQGIILSLREQIKKGSSFSLALSKYPETFPPLFRALIVAGETVGRLDEALERLSEQLSAQRRSKQKLISALLYPGVLSLLLIVALIIMVFFVVPSIETLFEGRSLPLFTAFVLSITHFIHRYLYLLLFTGISVVGAGIYYLSNAELRAKLVLKLFRWPILGQYLLKSSLARFSRTLSNLLLGGMPLSSALEYSVQALGNKVLEDELGRASQQIIEGASFSAALTKSEHLPPLFSRMVVIGEETGRLAPILANVALLYEEDSERTLDRAVNLIQPLLLVTMGVLIGAMLFAVLLPLADFGSNIDF